MIPTALMEILTLGAALEVLTVAIVSAQISDGHQNIVIPRHALLPVVFALIAASSFYFLVDELPTITLIIASRWIWASFSISIGVIFFDPSLRALLWIRQRFSTSSA